jgi:hypothetical protein
MRWLVEVSSLGKTDNQKICVDAESWQRALQAARAQRGEEGPMSGFSIELLEEGYRAVDPVARVRFVVKRAADDMPVTPAAGKSGAPPAPASAPASTGKKSIPPRPAAEESKELAKKKKSQTLAFGSSGETAAQSGTQAIEPAPLLAVGAAVPGLPDVKVLARREQEPTDASPLTYREYAFAVKAGTSEETAVAILRAQLRIVEGHVTGAKMGKLVNLAIFDVEFKGKPPKPPLATLTWKDWKGDPVVAYPQRASASKPPPRPPETPSSPPASLPVEQPRFPPPSAAPVIVAAPVPVPAPVPVAVPVAVPVPVPEIHAASAPAQAAPPAPPPPPAASVATQPVAPPTPVMTEAEPTKRPSHPPSGMVKTPSGRFVRGRASGDELITSLFEAMHDLHFLRDALDGGQFCLALATEVLPSRAAFIHFFDIEKREWVIACVRGKDTQRLLTMRTKDNDEMLVAAARRRRAVVTPNAAESATAERYRVIGGGRSLIIAPIMQAGRALGALEIVNPLDGMPFNEDEANAMTYIAEQFAEYLGSRGIVLDRERIQSAAAAH